MKVPNFLVVGDLKAGSTSIYHYLRQHPEIFMPRAIKELRYFAYDPENPYHRRATTFPVRTYPEYLTYFQSSEGAIAIGEASPNYLRSPIAACRIAETLPSIRIIASLRNPADRLYSQYLMALREGRTSKPFDEEAFGRDAALIKASYYWDDLKRYFDRFPREKIKIVLFDDLKLDSAAVTRDLYRFLGVSPDFVPNLKVQNEGGMPRNRRASAAVNKAKTFLRGFGSPPRSLASFWRRMERRSLHAVPLDPLVRRKILELCREDARRTQELIGRDLSFWFAP